MMDDFFMLTVGWVSGVVSTLLIRHALARDERRPIDPALLPTPSISVPTSRAKIPPQVGRPDLSPYAPKRPRLDPMPRPPRPPRPLPPRPPKPPAPPPAAADLLPKLTWGI